MEVYRYPDKDAWTKLSERALTGERNKVSEIVAKIIADVRIGGDEAVIEYERRFTGANIEALEVGKAELVAARQMISIELVEAIDLAKNNIVKFHEAMLMSPIRVETMPGVICEQKAVAIDRVGLYIPGGNSSLFSTVLMLALPAKIAGCREIVLCTPARSDGSIDPTILYAAYVAGVDKVYKIGGAQAIAAMAYGTETVSRVDKIFGPGNRYVTEAKQQVAQAGVAIDMPAGPSEVAVVADACANVSFVAADLLSQAEHGLDSQSILVTDSEILLNSVKSEIEKLLPMLPRREMMRKSLSHSRLILMKSIDEVMDFVNFYAPEHLIINHRHARELCEKIRNAGSVFIGAFSPESAGDYASGTNHTLPTSGFARAYSGVNVDSFTKKITFQELTPDGVRLIGRAVEVMAEAEDLLAHKLAMTLRLNAIKDLK